MNRYDNCLKLFASNFNYILPNMVVGKSASVHEADSRHDFICIFKKETLYVLKVY